MYPEKKSNNINLTTINAPDISKLVLSIYSPIPKKYVFVFKFAPFDDDEIFISTSLDYADAKKFHAMLLPIVREPEYMTKLKKAEFMSAVDAPDLKKEIDVLLPCSKNITLNFVYRQEKYGYMVAHFFVQEGNKKIHLPLEIFVERFYDPSTNEEVMQIFQIGLTQLIRALERYFEHVDNINTPSWPRIVHPLQKPWEKWKNPTR